MLNIFGDVWFFNGVVVDVVMLLWDMVVVMLVVYLYLYGKEEVCVGCKMGYVNFMVEMCDEVVVVVIVCV